MVKLRDYQREAYGKVVEKFKKTKEALVVMATGLGKTILAAFWAMDEIKEGSKGLFLCHDIGILDQSIEKFRFVMGNDPVFAKFYGVNGNKKEVSGADIIFSSFQTMKNNLDFFGKEWFDFIIVDESHHGHAPTFKGVIKHFKPKKLLGITATPDRMDMQNIREIFGEEVVNYSLEEAIAKNWLVPIEYRVITDSLKLDNLKDIIKDVTEKGERPSIQDLDRLLFGKLMDADIAKTIRQYSGDEKRTIIFCRDIKEAEKMRTLLPKSEACHSNLKRDDVDKHIHRLRTGELTYLTAVNQLNEGIDVPAIGLIALNRKTASSIIWSQQIGRGTRKDDDKEKIVLLDFVVNCARLIAVKKMIDKIKSYGERNCVIKSADGIDSEFILTDEQIDILELLKKIKVSFYTTWQEAGKAAVRLGIKSSGDYIKNYKKDPRLHSAPNILYPDFPDWYVFLGKEAKEAKYATWQEAGKAAVRLGIISASKNDYPKKYKRDQRLPASPQTYYHDFPGWEVFLGRETKYATWQEAGKAAIKLRMKGKSDYEKNYKKDSRLPSTPGAYYSDFPCWKVFLGGEAREANYATWQEAGKAAVRLGIKSSGDYIKNYKKDPRLHSAPSACYHDFPGWKVFLEKK